MLVKHFKNLVFCVCETRECSRCCVIWVEHSLVLICRNSPLLWITFDGSILNIELAWSVSPKKSKKLKQEAYGTVQVVDRFLCFYGFVGIQHMLAVPLDCASKIGESEEGIRHACLALAGLGCAVSNSEVQVVLNEFACRDVKLYNLVPMRSVPVVIYQTSPLLHRWFSWSRNYYILCLGKEEND